MSKDGNQEMDLVLERIEDGLRLASKGLWGNRRNWELMKVRASVLGYQISTPEDELDRLEYGRVIHWDTDAHLPLSHRWAA